MPGGYKPLSSSVVGMPDALSSLISGRLGAGAVEEPDRSRLPIVGLNVLETAESFACSSSDSTSDSVLMVVAFDRERSRPCGRLPVRALCSSRADGNGGGERTVGDDVIGESRSRNEDGGCRRPLGGGGFILNPLADESLEEWFL